MEVVERRLDMYQRPVLGHSESWPDFCQLHHCPSKSVLQNLIGSLKAGHGTPYRGDQFGYWAGKYIASPGA